MFKEELDLVPNKPGSYQMYNNNNIIIYVGKAKNLKKRLTSYFRGTNTGKTAIMVSEIAYFKYIITTTELESFILELNLIKKYNPKYNILLKDDKSYPYIEYTKKPFPTLKVTRYLKIKKNKDKVLFGPYVNSYAARRIVNLINRLYPLKKCNTMPKEVCLYYHIHECLGYCVKEIPNEEILAIEKEILSFLRGNEDIIKNKLLDKIDYYSKEMNYELALELKNELEYIEVVLEKQKVQFLDKEDMDVINYYFNNGYLAIEILFIRSGKLIGTFNDIFTVTDNYLEEIEAYIALFYQKNEKPKEIYLPSDLNLDNLNNIIDTKILTVSRGKKKKLLLMAKDNAKINHENNFKKAQNKLDRTRGANDELSALLGINITRIDIFDNSNLFGSFSVSGMVVFIDGMPHKNKYRKYKILLDKNDDYNTMKEVIYRRYYRALMEKDIMPELIIVDGGINQIRAAREVLDSLNLNIKVCGLVKNNQHKTSDLIDGNTLEAYKIDKTSKLFHYLTRIQDEVHRYTINYHKQIRSKGSIASVLDNVPGIGPKRKKELIKAFGSVKNMKEKNIEELNKYLPIKTAEKLYKYLKQIKN
ncbi:MAG: excinuclease ABC subunit UvrC [Bacilli bacterium]|nr:excinuclease ABC subunit UvrC [Bacilli bacterium]MDD4795358.1 excinuclease ABC subunit UvrC [Bacilli bacterium]